MKLLTIMACVVVALAGAHVASRLTNRLAPSGASTNSAASEVAEAPRTNLPVAAVPTNVMQTRTDLPAIDTNDLVQLLNHGTELLNRGRMDEAIEVYQQALKLNPDEEEVHFNLAYALSRQGKIADAIRHYSEALRIFPDYAEAHNNLGNLYTAMKNYDQAMSHFSAAIKINPEHSSALNNLGRCLAQQGQTKEAILQFSEALRLNPDYVEARFNLGSACLSLGRLDEAIAQFEQVLKLAPSFQPAIKGLERARARKAAERK